MDIGWDLVMYCSMQVTKPGGSLGVPATHIHQ